MNKVCFCCCILLNAAVVIVALLRCDYVVATTSLMAIACFSATITLK